MERLVDAKVHAPTKNFLFFMFGLMVAMGFYFVAWPYLLDSNASIQRKAWTIGMWGGPFLIYLLVWAFPKFMKMDKDGATLNAATPYYVDDKPSRMKTLMLKLRYTLFGGLPAACPLKDSVPGLEPKESLNRPASKGIKISTSILMMMIGIFGWSHLGKPPMERALWITQNQWPS
jgi:hypothetical protein